MVLYDAVATNPSYFLVLVMRFYVSNELHLHDQEALGLTAKKLLEYTSGPMDVLMNGLTASFENSIKALTNLHRSHDVQHVYADGGMIILNDTQTDWVKHMEEECCSAISFFYADQSQ